MKHSIKLAFKFLIGFVFIGLSSCSQTTNNSIDLIEEKPLSPLPKSHLNVLTKSESQVIIDKGTEPPNSGKYLKHDEKGIYLCKQCDLPLFESNSKFDSRSGWPSFDDVIGSNVEEVVDNDGYRTEIVCDNCKGHLGHSFYNEGFTKKNTRHCVNSISLKFVNNSDLINKVTTSDTNDTAIFASGCFWGTEYYFEKAPGVISTQVGYIGGHIDNPTYKEVCTGLTNHAEAVRVVFDHVKTDYETLCKLFYETHDPTEINRQGPDIGTQYRSEIFYLNQDQKDIAVKLKFFLESKGIKIATNITKATIFWSAEDYHEHYYSNKGGTPYCHSYTKRF